MTKLPGVFEIDVGEVSTWSDFHELFATRMGFPEFYGRNMDAWIDCMTSLDAPDDGLSTVHAGSGGVLTLNVVNAARLKSRNAEIWEALNECAAFVNWRRNEVGEPSVLALSYEMQGDVT